MSAAVEQSMSRAEFFGWSEAQEERFEFDGLRPVAMTRGNINHSRLIRNINRHLAGRLAGGQCESFGPEAGVATIGDAVRYPDAVVTCSPVDGKARLVPDPVVVFEVVSPSSVRIDRVVKLREYQAVPSIRRYVVVEPDAIAITVFERDADDSQFQALGLAEGDTLHLPELGIELPVADIYEGIL